MRSIFLIILLLVTAPVMAGSIVINEIAGFDDNTAATPVGLNTGTTVGQQRSIAFAEAAAIWTTILQPAVNITVDARFPTAADNDPDYPPLSCNATGAVVGSAGPSRTKRDFPEATFNKTWYPESLYQHLSSDTSFGAAIDATFNANIGNTGCLEGFQWYYGLDHNSDPETQLDFLEVILHEMAHGLGFITFVNLNIGTEAGGYDDIFERFLRDNSSKKTWTSMSNVERKASATNSNKLVWKGDQVRHMISALSSGLTSNYPQMYAPAQISTGSSVSHWDTDVTYIAGEHELMEYQEHSDFDMALTVALMRDIGWDGAFYDYDGDAVDDEADPFPADATETLDTDNDGIGNNTDTDDDGDGMPDTWENSNGLNSLVNDASGDLDGDDLSNLDEKSAGSDPQLDDTDGDNILDGVDSDPTDDAALFDVFGIQAAEHLGSSVATGDVNNDGYDDIIIGSPDYDASGSKTNAGRVQVVSGEDGSTPLLSINGAKAGDKLGFAVAAGDVDNDGYADVIVSTPYQDVLLSGTTKTDVGAVTVYSGADLSITLLQLTGDGANDVFGFAVAAGDVNNDGYADVIVGAPYDNDSVNSRTDSGSISVYSGIDSTPIIPPRYGSHTGDLFGSTLATGDVNNDGYGDVAVSAPKENTSPIVIKDAGSVTVLSGNDLGGVPLIQQFGARASDNFGKVLFARDINADSYADIIIGTPQADYKPDGSPLETDAGSVMIFDGADLSNPLFILFGSNAGDKLGSSLAIMDDMDADTVLDVLVGASGFNVSSNTADAGQVMVLSGDDGVLLASRNGINAGDNYCSSAASGDINNDGARDVVIGGKGVNSSGLSDAGSLNILSGNAFGP